MRHTWHTCDDRRFECNLAIVVVHHTSGSVQLTEVAALLSRLVDVLTKVMASSRLIRVESKTFKAKIVGRSIRIVERS